MATGWLIRPDLVVTAGHCVYDHAHYLGKLTHIKAYIGYAGKDSITDPGSMVQMRIGKSVCTTSKWFESGVSETGDVAFVLLEKPFTDVKPIKYAETPLSDTLKLGIVGYPGDLIDEHGEKGAVMWEMYLATKFDLTTSNEGLLQYQIDTYGGK
jgi:V8-like Glu-specific endopeptidase